MSCTSLCHGGGAWHVSIHLRKSVVSLIACLVFSVTPEDVKMYITNVAEDPELIYWNTQRRVFNRSVFWLWGEKIKNCSVSKCELFSLLFSLFSCFDCSRGSSTPDKEDWWICHLWPWGPRSETWRPCRLVARCQQLCDLQRLHRKGSDQPAQEIWPLPENRLAHHSRSLFWRLWCLPWTDHQRQRNQKTLQPDCRGWVTRFKTKTWDKVSETLKPQ